MSNSGRHPRLLFVDSGLGGLTVLSAARNSVPEADVLYIADDAGFPYGSKSDAVLTARLVTIIEAGVRDFEPDCIVLACNTASTIALETLRQSFPIPIVGTVPAVKPAAALTRSGFVSVLATPATVAREYTRTLIQKFGAGAHFTLVGAPTLARPGRGACQRRGRGRGDRRPRDRARLRRRGQRQNRCRGAGLHPLSASA